MWVITQKYMINHKQIIKKWQNWHKWCQNSYLKIFNLINYAVLLVAACWRRVAVGRHHSRLSHVKRRYYDIDYGGDDAHSEDRVIPYVGCILIFCFVDVERRA